jgi:rubrerythrin
LTEHCLKEAFAHEAQAYRRYLYFANQAEIEGHPEIASLFRSTAQGEVGHANGHLEFLQAAGDPVTGLPFGTTRNNLASAVASENLESGDMYVRMGKVARQEGFDEVADWFESLAKAELSHATRYQKALAQFQSSSTDQER